jgi:hypothetical protein
MRPKCARSGQSPPRCQWSLYLCCISRFGCCRAAVPRFSRDWYARPPEVCCGACLANGVSIGSPPTVSKDGTFTVEQGDGDGTANHAGNATQRSPRDVPSDPGEAASTPSVQLLRRCQRKQFPLMEGTKTASTVPAMSTYPPPDLETVERSRQDAREGCGGSTIYEILDGLLQAGVKNWAQLKGCERPHDFRLIKSGPRAWRCCQCCRCQGIVSMTDRMWYAQGLEDGRRE